MPDLEAEPLDDLARGYPTLTRVLTGYTGQRPFLVNTRDADVALTAAGLPIVGVTPYSPLLPNVLCTQIGPTELWGGSNGPTGTGAWTKVNASFATPAMDGSIIPPRRGLAYTLWNPGVTSVHIAKDIRYQQGPPFNTPIEGTSGTTAERGVIEAQVVLYPGDIPGDLFARMTRLAAGCRLNDAPITMPPVYGSTFAPELDRGQARYRTFSIGMDGELLKLTHSIAVSESYHFYPWAKTDADGLVIPGSEILSQLYDIGSFANLW